MRTLAAVLALTILPVAARAADTVPLWGRWSRAFAAASAADPKTDLTVELSSPSGRRVTAASFWDGGTTWRVRFMPDEVGRWSYRSVSTPATSGLDRQTGTFECRRSDRNAHRFLRHGAVRVAAGRYHLEHADGRPFFWLGDTVWNGALLSQRDDWNRYLFDRLGKRFSAIQFVMISPWRTAPTNLEGEVAFTGHEEIEIQPRFFLRIDERMDAANEQGMLAVPVLLWAIRGDENPGHSLPESQALRLARYLVARYGAHHVAWILAGDANYTGEIAERWKRIGRALFGSAPHAPALLHPGGMQWPYDGFRGEAWLDVLGYQSGHGDDAKALAWIHSGPVARAWREGPAKPIINLEPPYEDHITYQSRQPHSAYNVRRSVYWSLFAAPIAGVTYGAHGLWSWETTARVPLRHERTGMARPWHEALALPGSTDMKHVAELFEAFPWYELRPAPDLVEAPAQADDPAHQISAAQTRKGDNTVVYLPVGGAVRLRSAQPGTRAAWFDPRTGAFQETAVSQDRTYHAPDASDWVLVLRRR